MQVKIFYGYKDPKEGFKDLEKKINEFLKGLPFADVVNIQTLVFPSWGQDVSDAMAVLICLRADAQ